MWKISVGTTAILIITFIKIINATEDPNTKQFLVFLMLILIAIIGLISFILKDKNILKNKKKTCSYLIGTSVIVLSIGFLLLKLRLDVTEIISTILIIIGTIGIIIGWFVFLRF